MLENDRAGDGGGRQAHRPLPVVPRLHDDVPVGRALHASRRSRPRAHPGDLPPAAARPPAAGIPRERHAVSGAAALALGAAWLAKPLAPLFAAAGLKHIAAALRLAPPVQSAGKAHRGRHLSGRRAAQGPRRAAVRLRQRGARAATSRRPPSACSTATASRWSSRRRGLLRLARPPHGPRARCAGAGARQYRRLDAEIEGEGLDAILVTISGCGTTVKDYGFMLRTDPAYADKARGGLGQGPRRIRVSVGAARDAAHETERRLAGWSSPTTPPARCSTARAFTASRGMCWPELGFVVKDIAEGHLCCGSAGTYNILQPDIAPTAARP